MITPQQAHANLTKVLINGRITLEEKSLSLLELDSLMQSVKLLYDAALEYEESKKATKDKPAEDKRVG